MKTRGKCTRENWNAASWRLGFTLIELLVVIAIIALLAALLLPALAKAKGKAQSTACLSDAKQWVLAFWMYEDENEDFFPYEGNGFAAINTGQNIHAWYNTTAEYAGQQKLMDLYAQGNPPSRGQKSLFVCPSATNTAMPTIAKPIFFYGFNNRLDPNGSGQFKRSEVWYPAETVTFTEAEENNFPATSGVYTRARHDQRANLGFADGHAAVIGYADFHRKPAEDNSTDEFNQPRTVYWWPYPGAAP